ncbi:protein BREAST CANCER SUSCEPTIBILITY 1 homolog [Tripterygium wilfordii]|uniref:protein BREAST CANCER SUSCEPTIBILITY 1 homolog n=1 Tax=Tripterygium wilfordii TaxID=458696 RepID=UPI0018F81FD8|nr:protein BREAST CANCER SUSCEPTIBILITY 1 homolog [Tripterygium wilfordii]
MGDPVHLERMGRELKCPICLSLLNSTVSLPCNHVFCNLCIMKSMKSDSSCPVCKVPYRRREIRAASHMDNLVSIYKSMEVASGINIFVTQNAPPTRLSDEEKCEDVAKCDGQETSKGKRLRKSVKPKLLGPTNAKPSFPTKKRVQVPQYPLSETPKQPMKSGNGYGENTEDGSKSSSLISKENMALNGKEKPQLSPFFWLRDEDAENLSQDTDMDQSIDMTPPIVPSFSDIKDSYDDNPTGFYPTGKVCGKSSGTDVFDSEMFEWTQRACSPELFSSPVKEKVSNTNSERNDGSRRKISELVSQCTNTKENSSHDNARKLNTKQGTGCKEKISLTYSSSRTRSTHSEILKEKPDKKSGKARETARKKFSKKNAHQSNVFHVNLNEDSENFSQTSKRVSPNSDDSAKRMKACSSTTAVKLTPENLPAVSVRAESDNILGTGRLLDSSSKSAYHETDHGLRSKRQKVDSLKISRLEEVPAVHNQANEDTIAQVSLSVPLDDNKKASASTIPNKHNKAIRLPSRSKSNREMKQNKKVSFDCSSKNVLVDGIQDSHTDVSTKEFHLTEKIEGSIHVSVVDGLLEAEKLSLTNRVALSKCGSVTSKIQCSFCLSSEDTEASGEMIHYLNGKPVSADYNGGSKIIHSHRNCSEWAPNIYFEADTAINLEAELVRSRRIKCCVCGLKGAALGCYETSCRKSFHIPCAKLIPQCRWDAENFVMLCPLHLSSKLPSGISGSQERKLKKCIPKVKPYTQYNNVADIDGMNASRKRKLCKAFDKIVLCCSALTVGEREIISEFERFSGVTVLKTWNSSVTHVIASVDDNKACKRTLKILMGILEGKWILNIEWVKACINAMEPIDEEQYEITVDIHGIRDGPRLGRLRVANKQPRLFDGFMFHFVGDFVPSYKSYLQDLVVAGGGAILHRKPVSGQVFGSPAASTFIVYSQELPERCDPGKSIMTLSKRHSDAEALASSTGTTVVSNLWVLNSIAACKLQGIGE